MSTPTVTEVRRKMLETVMCAGLTLDTIVDVRLGVKTEFTVANGQICNTEAHLVITNSNALFDTTYRVPWGNMETFRVSVGQHISIEVALN